MPAPARAARAAALIAAAAAMGLASASTASPAWLDAGGEPRAQDPLEDGLHRRIGSERGPIHVFQPRGYEASSAGTVIYLHGYYTDVDAAWEDHRLAEQFERSGRNALFIAAASPRSNGEGVAWSDLGALLHHVREAGLEVPGGARVAIAHSGGFRTVVPWLSSGLLDAVVLLDGLYNNLGEFEGWLRQDADRRLVLVGSETQARGEQLASRVPGAIERYGVPGRLAELSRDERQAPLLSLRSQFGHMEIVTGAQVIPFVLRLAPLAPL